MLIRFRCHLCHQLLGIADRRIGDIVHCPQCGADLVVPAAPRDVDGRGSAAAAPVAADPDEGFRVRRPATEFEDMDLTPMVDVTFLLLIFFMITASFSLTRSIEVPAPDPDQKGARQAVPREQLEARSIMVRIDERSTVSVDERPVEDMARLEDVLRDRMRAERKSELVIEADDRALHGTVVAVKDAATGAGMQTIRLARIREGGAP